MRPQETTRLSRLLAITIMIAVLGGAIALYFWLFRTPFMEEINKWTAQSAGLALKLTGANVDTTGTVVASDQFAYRIVAECTAVGPLLLYSAAVLAYPASLRSKVFGLGLGAVIISGINVVRLVSLFYVGTYWRQHLGELHLFFWQGLMMLSVVLLWLYWLRRRDHAT